MGIIIAILLFSFIIIFHELGHFLLAKANGIRVEEFSLGLGPTLIGKQIGETKFSIKLLPFGGACMMGEDDADDMSEGSFNSKSVWARMSVIAAGPVFNLILAWIMCVIIILAVGYQPAEISGVSEGYSAEEQGMQAGDVIKEINGRNVHIWNDISLYTLTHPDETSLEIVYERDGQEYNVVIEPRQLEGDQSPKLGVLSPGYVRTGILGAMEYGAYTVKYWVNYTVDSLRMLFTGKVGIRDLSGPVGIVDAVDSVYQASAPAGSHIEYDEFRRSRDGKPGDTESASHSGPGRRAPCIPHSRGGAAETDPSGKRRYGTLCRLCSADGADDRCHVQ